MTSWIIILRWGCLSLLFTLVHSIMTKSYISYFFHFTQISTISQRCGRGVTTFTTGACPNTMELVVRGRPLPPWPHGTLSWILRGGRLGRHERRTTSATTYRRQLHPLAFVGCIHRRFLLQDNDDHHSARDIQESHRYPRMESGRGPWGEHGQWMRQGFVRRWHRRAA